VDVGGLLTPLRTPVLVISIIISGTWAAFGDG
jgi:hypothetical protein